MPLDQATWPLMQAAASPTRGQTSPHSGNKQLARVCYSSLCSNIGALRLGNTVASLTWVEEQNSRSISLKAPLLVSVTLLLFTVPFAFTQKASVNKRAVEPQIQEAIAQPGTQTNAVLSNLLAFAPEIPRGPVEILRQYEDEMTLISQTFTIEISLITEAVHQGQVSPPQADYLMQQRFQIAMMQYEVLNALHDSLAFEVSRTLFTALSRIRRRGPRSSWRRQARYHRPVSTTAQLDPQKLRLSAELLVNNSRQHGLKRERPTYSERKNAHQRVWMEGLTVVTLRRKHVQRKSKRTYL